MTILLTIFQLTALFELYWLLLFFLPTDSNKQKLISSAVDPKNLSSFTGDPFLNCKASNGCGTCVNMTNEGGTIESINFPDEYNSNMNCNFTIDAPSGIKIRLSFQEFVVENCCDFITVFDGQNEPLEIGLNGYTAPDVITSSSHQMTVKFTTNSDNLLISSSSLGPGRWKATYTFIDNEDSKESSKKENKKSFFKSKLKG